MKTAKDLHDELDYWIHIGIADDIVKVSGQRPEYRNLVDKFKGKRDDDMIPGLVLAELKVDARRPKYFQFTFWHLLKLKIISKLRFW